MKILFVTSEASPYSASGGLGDVSGALPRAINKEGYECSVILPLYRGMNIEYKKHLDFVIDIKFDLSWRKTGARIYSHDNKGVRYYFIENHYYFDRPGLYGEYDDGERFAFFSKAVIEFILATKKIPDIVHANDWQSALSIVYLKTLYSEFVELKGIRTLYTIHNIEYQGKYAPDILSDVFGIDEKYRSVLEYGGCINLMKGGISASDHFNTVSPNYSKELEHNYFAFGLADLIKNEREKFSGIINGIDYSVFSPDNDRDVFVQYGDDDLFYGKSQNKRLLQRELGLTEKEDTPMLVMITRLTATKGIDLVLCVIDEILSLNLQMVILGTGEAEYETAFRHIAKKYDNFVALTKFDRALSKKLYAAADVFLMPSKSEPCGLSQMIACSYGAVPIVRSVGGLYDTITPYGEEGANGFRFDNYNAHELLFTLKKALAVYGDREEWETLAINAKKSKYTWEKSALKYIEIYDKIISDRKNKC